MHIHVVKRGDTLSSIAAMHDALPAFVAADNGLALSTPLVIGQALVVRTPKTLHTVRAGETLSSIARDYDLSVRTLLRRNFFLRGRELLREGDVIRSDFNEELGLLRQMRDNTGQFLLDLEKREREKTGLTSLRVEYNRVHGFYIEVSKGQAASVPVEYHRRQTLKNTERFITPELKNYEDQALSSKERSAALEKELYDCLLYTSDAADE